MRWVLDIRFHWQLDRSRAIFSSDTKGRARVDKDLLKCCGRDGRLKWDILWDIGWESEGPGRTGEPAGQTSCLPSAMLKQESRQPVQDTLDEFRNQGVGSGCAWPYGVEAGVYDWQWLSELVLPPSYVLQEDFNLYTPDPPRGHLKIISIQPKVSCISLLRGVLWP